MGYKFYYDLEIMRHVVAWCEAVGHTPFGEGLVPKPQRKGVLNITDKDGKPVIRVTTGDEWVRILARTTNSDTTLSKADPEFLDKLLDALTCALPQ